MKILMISDVFFPRVNGVSTSIQTFARELLAMGHEVVLIAPQYPEDIDEEFKVYRIKARQLPLDPEDYLMSKKAIKKIVPDLVRENFDMIHIQTPFIAHYAGIWLAERLKLPTVVSYHTYFEAYFDKYIKWLPAALLRYVARTFSRRQCQQVDAVISPSSAMQQSLLDYGVSKPISILPTGLVLDNYRRPDNCCFRHQHSIPKDDAIILYVGRVAHEKNIPFLLEAYQELLERKSNVWMVIAGEGPALASLKKLADDLDIDGKMIFVGYLDRETELMDCYHSADVFAFASETETQGLVLLEAMACELPVVSTASMGTRDVLKDGYGCLVAEAKQQDFVQKLMVMLTNSAIRESVINQGREYILNWTAAEKASDLVSLYEHLQIRYANDHAEGRVAATVQQS